MKKARAWLAPALVTALVACSGSTAPFTGADDGGSSGDGSSSGKEGGSGDGGAARDGGSGSDGGGALDAGSCEQLAAQVATAKAAATACDPHSNMVQCAFVAQDVCCQIAVNTQDAADSYTALVRNYLSQCHQVCPLACIQPHKQCNSGSSTCF